MIGSSGQIRLMDPETGEKWGFSPLRDIAYFHHQLVDAVFQGLEKSKWEPWIKDYLDAKGVGEDDVLRAAAAYARFCVLALDPDIKTPAQALEEAGFFSCPTAAQLVICAKIGQVSTGAWWQGIKEATYQGQVIPTIQKLREYALETEQQIISKWAKENEQGTQTPSEEVPAT